MAIYSTSGYPGYKNDSTNITSSSLNLLDPFIGEPYNQATIYQINQYISTSSTISDFYTTGTNDNTTHSTTETYMNIPHSSAYSNSTGYLKVNYNYNYMTHNLSINVENLNERELKYQKIRSKIKSNLLIQVKTRNRPIPMKVPENELTAQETLREYITEKEFRKYLRFGFVCIKGKSGKTYQIFRNRSHTKVWEDGKLIEEICIHIKDSKIPPTDSVIAFRTMIQSSEEDFRKMGNVYNMKRAA